MDPRHDPDPDSKRLRDIERLLDEKDEWRDRAQEAEAERDYWRAAAEQAGRSLDYERHGRQRKVEAWLAMVGAFALLLLVTLILVVLLELLFDSPTGPNPLPT